MRNLKCDRTRIGVSRSNVIMSLAYHWRLIGYTWNRRTEMFDSKMLLVILAIALVIFGTKRLRSIGTDLGAAVKGFNQAMSDGESEDKVKQIKQEKDADFDAGAAATNAQARETEAKAPPKTNA